MSQAIPPIRSTWRRGDDVATVVQHGQDPRGATVTIIHPRGCETLFVGTFYDLWDPEMTPAELESAGQSRMFEPEGEEHV